MHSCKGEISMIFNDNSYVFYKMAKSYDHIFIIILCYFRIILFLCDSLCTNSYELGNPIRTNFREIMLDRAHLKISQCNSIYGVLSQRDFFSLAM